jgi:hypothetical protein
MEYTPKQNRKVEHIEESYEARGLHPGEAEARAWATVNKQSGGGERPGGSGPKTRPRAAGLIQVQAGQIAARAARKSRTRSSHVRPQTNAAGPASVYGLRPASRAAERSFFGYAGFLSTMMIGSSVRAPTVIVYS